MGKLENISPVNGIERAVERLNKVPKKKKTIHPTFSLGYYTEKVKNMTEAELHYARIDLAKTIPLWDKTPGVYLDRLYNERDAILTEIQKRRNK